MTATHSFQTLRHTLVHKVEALRHLTESTYVLRCSRGDFSFSPGQHISVGPKNDLNMREYSIYSGVDEPFLEILVKEIAQGLVSKELKRLKPKDEIIIEGPLGFFTIEEQEFSKPLYFIATGTGISPFHCFALSYPSMPCTVLHGVGYAEELYDKQAFETQHIHYIACLSKEPAQEQTANEQPTNSAYYNGRVSKYLEQHEVDIDGIFFLCGNCDMIYEVFDILQHKGVDAERIKAEVYF